MYICQSINQIFRVMERNYKNITISAIKLLDNDNCKSIMNLQIKSLLGTDEFKTLPDWFINNCYYTADLIKNLRNVLLLNKDLLTDNEAKEFINKYDKENETFADFLK